LVKIENGDDVVFSGESPVLPFAPSENIDCNSKTIRKGVEEYVDFLFITDSNKVLIPFYKDEAPSSVDWGNLFARPGTYKFHIVIQSEAPTMYIYPTLHWAGARDTAVIACP
jgi:hypothetical protein